MILVPIDRSPGECFAAALTRAMPRACFDVVETVARIAIFESASADVCIELPDLLRPLGAHQLESIWVSSNKMPLLIRIVMAVVHIHIAIVVIVIHALVVSLCFQRVTVWINVPLLVRLTVARVHVH